LEVVAAVAHSGLQSVVQAAMGSLSATTGIVRLSHAKFGEKKIVSSVWIESCFGLRDYMPEQLAENIVFDMIRGEKGTAFADDDEVAELLPGEGGALSRGNTSRQPFGAVTSTTSTNINVLMNNSSSSSSSAGSTGINSAAPGGENMLVLAPNGTEGGSTGATAFNSTLVEKPPQVSPHQQETSVVMKKKASPVKIDDPNNFIVPPEDENKNGIFKGKIVAVYSHDRVRLKNITALLVREGCATVACGKRIIDVQDKISYFVLENGTAPSKALPNVDKVHLRKDRVVSFLWVNASLHAGKLLG
ncbi:unnamed protein product, partial [Amoebophrya sp. A25]